MSEVKTATGVCEEVAERGEWTTFHIDVGSQYPVKVSTKLQPVIELGRAASKAGGRMVWTYSESDGTENPHKPGTRYKNRYLTSVEPDTGLNSTPTPQNATSVEKADVDWDAKERRDYRSRAWAQTLGAFTHTIKVDESVEDVFARLQPFQRKVFVDVCESFAYPLTEHDENLPF